MILAAIIGLTIGIVAGIYCPYSIPPEYARLMAVAVMAGLDAVLGGIRASLASQYDTTVAILIFGMRIFQNIGVIRRLYMGK